MKVAILGSGVVGQVLASAFIKEGHHVTIGTGDINKKELTEWKKNNENGKVHLFSDAASWAELIVLAVKGTAASKVLEMAEIKNLSDKIIMDATNPIDDSKPPVNGVLNFFTDQNDSLMEQLQALAPEAKFVKAFNSVGNALMYKPSLKETPTMFIAGNDEAAKQTVAEIIESFGWETADMGKAEAARAIEPLCMLWCIPGFLQNQWGHAFKLLKP